MKHKRQHYIPNSYLQAWCDPNHPAGQTPYVWLFSKDGAQVRNKSPEKIFYEKDFYTIRAADGERDLILESNLSRLEGQFSALRKAKLGKRVPLSAKEHLILCMFVAAMYGRTKAYKEHWGKQWQQVLELGERMQQWMKTASPEDRDRAAKMLSEPHVNREDSLSLEDVRKIAEQPIQESLSGIVTGVSPMLFNIPFIIIETSPSLGFITSDSPCIWFDPAVYMEPTPSWAGGLLSPTIEITLPLSPLQMLFFSKGLSASGIYLPVDKETAENLNKRTRLGAHEYFVFNRKESRAIWF
jgi:hypothetical protein